MKSFYLRLIVTLALLAFKLYAETNPLQLKIDKESFKLLHEQEEYYLKPPAGENISIQKKWLFPPDQIKEDENSYVTSFNYEHGVHSFSISKDFIGLHISSYAIQKEGSAKAAAGRDVFLVFDTRNKKLNPGVINLGITKYRIRSLGYFSAECHNFFIGDINNDGFTDLGVMMERIWRKHYFDEKKQVDTISGPLYQKQPIKWYIFQSTMWTYHSKFDGKMPKNALIRLPLLGLVQSPIEFARCLYGEKLKEVK